MYRIFKSKILLRFQYKKYITKVEYFQKKLQCSCSDYDGRHRNDFWKRSPLFFLNVTRLLYLIYIFIVSKPFPSFGIKIYSSLYSLCTFSIKKLTLHKKTKFSIKDFYNKCDQICSFLRIWSHLLKKSLMENFLFCAV